MGEPFWFRLGRGKEKQRVRSPSPDEKPAPALSDPSFCEGGKQSSSPFVAGCTAALPSRTRQTEAERRWGGLPSGCSWQGAGCLRDSLACVFVGGRSPHTWYVSHRRMVQRRGSSRISRLFIQRKANCRYSTSYLLK